MQFFRLYEVYSPDDSVFLKKLHLPVDKQRNLNILLSP